MEQSPLLAIPPELQGSIIGHVDKRDLFAVRLVSKELNAAALGAFQKTFFTERSHSFTHRSLSVLIAITRQPHLRAKLTKLSFVVVRTDRVLCDDDGEHSGWFDRKPPSTALQKYAQMQHKQAGELGRYWIELHRCISQGTVRLLSRCLRNLARSHIYPALGIDSCMLHNEDDRITHNTYGIRDLRQFLHLGEPSYSEGKCLPQPDFAISALLAGIASTHYPIQHFFLHGVFSEKQWELENFNMINCMRADLDISFKGLKQLELTYKVVGCRMYQPLGGLIQHLASAAASSLVEVKFKAHPVMYWPGPRPSLTPNQLFSQCKIQKVEIADSSFAQVWTSTNPMADFFKAQTGLRELKLYGVDFRNLERNDDVDTDDESEDEDQPSYALFLDALTTMNLQTLELHDYEFGGLPMGSRYYHGSHAVQEGIQAVLEEMRTLRGGLQRLIDVWQITSNFLESMAGEIDADDSEHSGGEENGTADALDGDVDVDVDVQHEDDQGGGDEFGSAEAGAVEDSEGLPMDSGE